MSVAGRIYYKVEKVIYVKDFRYIDESFWRTALIARLNEDLKLKRNKIYIWNMKMLK